MAWSGTLLCQILSHTHTAFSCPSGLTRTSDGTVCVRVSVWVWGKWKVKVAVGTIPPCPPLHPHHIFHHPTILRQLAVGCPSLALFLLYSSFFSIGAPKLPADYSHKGNHLRVDAQVTLMHRPRPYTAHALIHMNSCKYTHKPSMALTQLSRPRYCPPHFCSDKSQSSRGWELELWSQTHSVNASAHGINLWTFPLPQTKNQSSQPTINHGKQWTAKTKNQSSIITHHVY